MNKRKILFVRLWNSSFINNDLELLRKHFHVRLVDFVIGVKRPYQSSKTIFSMINGILWADVMFTWFANSQALWAVRLSKIFGKKSIVVIGGVEVASEREIEYGSMLDRKSARMVKYILKNSNKVLAVSEFNKNEILKYTTPDSVEFIYNGIDCDKFKSSKNEKDDIVITVGAVSYEVIKRKGFETFIKSAQYLPNVKFVLIGKHIDNSIKYLKSIAPKNVEFTGFISDEELIKYYQRAKVYCQLSYYESFGVAPAEAMCCECVPVVTNKAALPEIIGDTGFYAPYGNPKATAEAIKKALNSQNGKPAKERIRKFFTLKRREKKLTALIAKIT